MISWDWTLTFDPSTGRQQRTVIRAGPGWANGSSQPRVRLLRSTTRGEDRTGATEQYPGVAGEASLADRFGHDRPFDGAALSDLLRVVLDHLEASPSDCTGPPSRSASSDELKSLVEGFLAEAEASGSARAGDLHRRLSGRRVPGVRRGETIGLARIVPAGEAADHTTPAVPYGADVLMPVSVSPNVAWHSARLCAETWLYADLFERFGKVSAASLRLAADRLSEHELVDDTNRDLAVVFLLDHPRRLAVGNGIPVAQIDPIQLDIELSAAARLLDRAGAPRATSGRPAS